MKASGTTSRTFACITLVMLALLAAGSPPASAANPRAEIKRTYDFYRDAILKDNGKFAVDYVCGPVIDYFGEIQELALYARKDELMAMPLLNQLQALQLRTMVPADELKAMSASDVFAHAVDNGWVLKNSVKQTQLGGIKITKDQAEAVIIRASTPAGGHFHFCKEDDQWKFNLLTVIEHSRHQLEGVARHRGLNGEEMVEQLLAGATGEEVKSKVWKPPFKKKKD